MVITWSSHGTTCWSSHGCHMVHAGHHIVHHKVHADRDMVVTWYMLVVTWSSLGTYWSSNGCHVVHAGHHMVHAGRHMVITWYMLIVTWYFLTVDCGGHGGQWCPFQVVYLRIRNIPADEQVCRGHCNRLRSCCLWIINCWSELIWEPHVNIYKMEVDHIKHINGSSESPSGETFYMYLHLRPTTTTIVIHQEPLNS